MAWRSVVAADGCPCRWLVGQERRGRPKTVWRCADRPCPAVDSSSHTRISKAEAWVAGTFHGLGSRHIQADLNEFCFRYNRCRSRTGALQW